jgi:hypothetical protein
MPSFLCNGNINNNKTNSMAFSPEAKYADRQPNLSVKLVPTFEGRMRRVVSCCEEMEGANTHTLL